MNISTYIYDWIQQMIVVYPWLSFKYEYSEKRNIHYIGVFTQTEVETNEAYCNDENLFASDLDIKYPEQIVLFGSDDTFYNFTDKALCYEVCVDNINLNSYILDEELNVFCNELEAICNTARKNTFNMNNQFALAA